MKKYNEYVGKWCLYKETWSSAYNNVFIYAIKDGIVKYTPETNLNYIGYEDLSFFEKCKTFRINPIQSNRLDQYITKEIDDTWEKRIPSIPSIPRREEPRYEYIDGCGWISSDRNKHKGPTEYYIGDPWVGSDSTSSKCVCDHEWFECMLTSYPPIRSRTCKKCGKQEHMENGKWVDGYC